MRDMLNQPWMFTAITTLFLFYLALSFHSYYNYILQKESLLEKLKLQSDRQASRETLRERLRRKILEWSERLGPISEKLYSFPEQDQKWLTWAGRPMGLTLQRFYGLRLLMAIFGAIFGLFYFILGLPFSKYVYFIAPVAGFFGTTYWLRSRADRRQEEISVTLPTFLDTVSIALAAGGALMQTIEEVAERMGGALSEEMLRMVRELQLGVSRRQAYQNLIDRNRSRELESFVQALIQGSDLGVPIATTFRVQADEMRASRVFRAKEKAAKASPRITLVTTLLITPAIFILILGLVVLNFIYNPDAFNLQFGR
ncbi:type II secretion system F family protein [Hydrogenibacillus schlegelii]